MVHVRRSVGWVSALTLALQLVTATVLPVTACCLSSEPGGSETPDCCKSGEPHACPMPGKSAPAASDEGDACRMTACRTSDDAALSAIFGPMGVPVEQSHPLVRPVESSIHPSIAVAATRWLSRFESPPPEA
jgi:hypothetical protein